jgi:hypothetical protein
MLHVKVIKIIIKRATITIQIINTIGSRKLKMCKISIIIIITIRVIRISATYEAWNPFKTFTLYNTIYYYS